MMNVATLLQPEQPTTISSAWTGTSHVEGPSFADSWTELTPQKLSPSVKDATQKEPQTKVYAKTISEEQDELQPDNINKLSANAFYKSQTKTLRTNDLSQNPASIDARRKAFPTLEKAPASTPDESEAIISLVQGHMPKNNAEAATKNIDIPEADMQQEGMKKSVSVASSEKVQGPTQDMELTSPIDMVVTMKSSNAIVATESKSAGQNTKKVQEVDKKAKPIANKEKVSSSILINDCAVVQSDQTLANQTAEISVLMPGTEAHPAQKAERGAATATESPISRIQNDDKGAAQLHFKSATSSMVDSTIDNSQPVDGVAGVFHEISASNALPADTLKAQESSVITISGSESKMIPSDIRESNPQQVEGEVSLIAQHISSPDIPLHAAAEDQIDHRMLAATATSLDVGIANGMHGWLKVRTELNDGIITASLSASSSSGQGMLHRELPSLNTFLAQEQIAVKTTVVDRNAGSFGWNSSAMGGTESGEKREQNQSSLLHGSQGEGRPDRGSAWNDSEPVNAYSRSNENGLLATISEINYTTGGGWLSVRV